MEIFQVPLEKTFVGKAVFKMDVHVRGSEFDRNGYGYILSRNLESLDDLKIFVRDPGNQNSILGAAANAMRSKWSNKVLNKTWHETKDMFFATYRETLDKFLDSLKFELHVSYEIILSKQTKTGSPDEQLSHEIFSSPWERNGMSGPVRTEPELVKTYLLHELIDEGSLDEMKSIFSRGLEVLVEEEMKPFMEDEVTRRENDLELLKILTRRYPNYQDLIKQEKA